jgi:uncharacterized protein YdaU (DUF1376 family)
MSGLSRFDFYPRDWHLDTRDLSAAAKGIYIDLLSGIYARGGPLPYKERELCQLCGCATARSLRPLLAELISKGKIKVIDGHLTNGRAIEEIGKAERRKAIAKEGGDAKAEASSAHVQPEFGSNSARTHLENRPDIEQNQEGNVCSPSPSPSPSKKEDPPTEGADAPVIFDPKRPLYDLGKDVLGPSAGGQVTRILRQCAGDIDSAMRTLAVAKTKSNPGQYIGGILRGQRPPEPTDWDAEYRRIGVSL